MEQATRRTLVYYEGTSNYDKSRHIFDVIENRRVTNLWVSGYEDGFVKVDPLAGTIFEDFAEVVAGCFDNVSNFFDEVAKVLFIERDTIKGIRFEFNGTVVYVTPENADPKKIHDEWKATMDANREKARQEREAWLKTPEGLQYLAEKEAEEQKRNILTMAVITVDESTKMEFADEEAKKEWNQLVKINRSDCGSTIMRFARRWAKYMQVLISEGKQVADIAEETSHICDIDGVSSNMFACVVESLVRTWKYGKELHEWHKKEYGYEGDGVVNPAVVNVTD